MHQTSLSAHLAVIDADRAQITYDHTGSYGLRHLRLGAGSGQVVIDLPLLAADAARFLRRLAETATHAAHALDTAD